DHFRGVLGVLLSAEFEQSRKSVLLQSEERLEQRVTVLHASRGVEVSCDGANVVSLDDAFVHAGVVESADLPTDLGHLVMFWRLAGKLQDVAQRLFIALVDLAERS